MKVHIVGVAEPIEGYQVDFHIICNNSIKNTRVISQKITIEIHYSCL